MEVMRELREDTLDAAPGDIGVESHVPPALNPPDVGASQTQSNSPQNSSIYTMACDQSLMSRQVEQWMGVTSPIQSTGVQGSRPTVMQRSTLAPDTEALLPGSGVWYILALMMPLLNIADASRWRCSQNAVLNFMELVSSTMARACSQIRFNIRSLVHNHVTREIFATAMDVVLVIYAIGFLILSAYQAAIFT